VARGPGTVLFIFRLLCVIFLFQSGAFCFDRLQQEAAVLLSVKKSELVEHVSGALGKDSRRKMTVHVLGKRVQELHKEQRNSKTRAAHHDAILVREDEIEDFRKTLKTLLFDPSLTAR
jgi:hypothetical protein